MTNNRRRPESRHSWWNSLGIPLGITLALLAGCSDPTQFAPACPSLRLLGDAGDLASFNERGHDVTDLLVSARITAIPAACSPGGRGKTAATMHVQMRVERGPALPGRVAPVPFFITIMDGDNVLQQQDYFANIEFPANVDTVTVDSKDIELSFPVTAKKSAAAYTIYVGFRLTPQQLQYNRRGVSR
jgi:hypothetical protein